MQLKSFKIIPCLGLKDDVSADDPSLFYFLGEGVAKTHDTDGVNIDYSQYRNACSKSWGRTEWSNSAISSPDHCQKLFWCEQADGTNWRFNFENGRLYYYDGSRDPQQITDGGGGPNWSTGDDVHPAMLMYADKYVIISDGTITPYKWDLDAADPTSENVTKLIQSGTEYDFKYMTEWQRRIIGAHTNQTNGDIEIRYTDALPTFGSLEFAAANQLYKPTTDPITGMHKLGANSLFIFGSDSISKLTYYANASIPFGITAVIDGQGLVDQESIVETAGALWFFNKNYGFVRYTGSNRISAKDVISKDIESTILDINDSIYETIVGTSLPPDKIVWAVPIGISTYPDYLLFYNIFTGDWSLEGTISTKYFDKLVDRSSTTYGLVSADVDGKIYMHYGDTMPSSALSSYRIEPVMDFGIPEIRKHLMEIWYGIVSGGDYELHTWHRSGDTVKECLASGWTALDTLNLNSPADPVIYLNQTARYHQIKWGTNADNEPYTINWIILKYSIQGEY